MTYFKEKLTLAREYVRVSQTHLVFFVCLFFFLFVFFFFFFFFVFFFVVVVVFYNRVTPIIIMKIRNFPVLSKLTIFSKTEA